MKSDAKIFKNMKKIEFNTKEKITNLYQRELIPGI